MKLLEEIKRALRKMFGIPSMTPPAVDMAGAFKMGMDKALDEIQQIQSRCRHMYRYRRHDYDQTTIWRDTYTFWCERCGKTEKGLIRQFWGEFEAREVITRWCYDEDFVRMRNDRLDRQLMFKRENARAFFNGIRLDSVSLDLGPSVFPGAGITSVITAPTLEDAERVRTEIEEDPVPIDLGWRKPTFLDDFDIDYNKVTYTIPNGVECTEVACNQKGLPPHDTNGNPL